jgi:hypothetical protein
MPLPRGLVEQFEPSDDDLPEALPVVVPDASPAESETIAGLLARIAEYQAANAVLKL